MKTAGASRSNLIPSKEIDKSFDTDIISKMIKLGYKYEGFVNADLKTMEVYQKMMNEKLI